MEEGGCGLGRWIPLSLAQDGSLWLMDGTAQVSQNVCYGKFDGEACE